MKKIIKVISMVAVVVIVLSSIFCVVDGIRIMNDKSPIFSIDKSGGSVLLYVGSGYIVVNGDDYGHKRFKDAHIESWISALIEGI